MRSVACVIAVLVGAVSASACGWPAVRELDRKNEKMTALPEGLSPGVNEIKTPDELAKSKFFVDDPGRDAIGKQVDFTNQKIVVISWWGSSTSWVEYELSKDGKKVRFSVVKANPALADMRSHVRVFAVRKDVVVETPLDRIRELLDELTPRPEIVKLSMKDVKLIRDRNELPPKAIVIASVEDLAKSRLFADDASRSALAKQIDFGKQKIVLFVWSGSGGDRITAAQRREGETRTAIFTSTRGETDDLRDHAAAFAVPRDCDVKVVKG
jgi:hypothetical protein